MITIPGLVSFEFRWVLILDIISSIVIADLSSTHTEDCPMSDIAEVKEKDFSLGNLPFLTCAGLVPAELQIILSKIERLSISSENIIIPFSFSIAIDFI